MIKTLFSFQQRAIDDIWAFLFEDKKYKSGLGVLPTGSGKSVILAKLSQMLEGHKVLMIVPSVELLKQNYQAILNEGGNCSLYSASVDSKEISGLTLATIGSLKGKASEFKGFKYVLVDEAHYKFNSTADEAVFKTFIREVKPKKLLGLTATPFMLDSVKGQPALKMLPYMRPKLFQEIIHVTQVQEVIKAGRWAKIVYEQHPVNKSSLTIGGAEYTKESVDLFLRENDINNRICLKLSELCAEKTLTFVPTVDIADKMAEWFNKKHPGYKAAVVSALTPKKEREQLIKDFKDMNNTLNHIINFGTLTTGFDFPELAHIIGGRPTMSLSLYYQMLGRGCRVHKDKPFMTYYDMCDNTSFFGDVQELSIEFFKGAWRCFIGDKLFTGFPLNCGLHIDKDFILNPPKVGNIDYGMTMWFGKYKGDPLKKIPPSPVFKLPNWYRKYLLESLSTQGILDKKEAALLELLIKLQSKDIISIF